MELLDSRETIALRALQSLRRAQANHATELFNAFRNIQLSGDWQGYFEVLGGLMTSNRSRPDAQMDYSDAPGP
jgi:hypothetical protein